MLVLSIDTSAAAAVALVEVIGDDVAIRATAIGTGPRRQVEELSALVDQVIRPDDAAGGPVVPDLVAVGTGPAAFTGLRVGIVTARALARAWGSALTGVSTLDVLAAQALAATQTAEVTIVTDARRREVFFATYERGDHIPGGPPVPILSGTYAVGPPDQVPTAAPAAGPGVGLLSGGRPDPIEGIDAADPVVLGALAARDVAAGNLQDTEPKYLRRPDIHGQGPTTTPIA